MVVRVTMVVTTLRPPSPMVVTDHRLTTLDASRVVRGWSDVTHDKERDRGVTAAKVTAICVVMTMVVTTVVTMVVGWATHIGLRDAEERVPAPTLLLEHGVASSAASISSSVAARARPHILRRRTRTPRV